MFATATAPILWELCDSLRARWTITPCSGALQYGTFELMCKGAACLLAMCSGGSVKPDWMSRQLGNKREFENLAHTGRQDITSDTQARHTELRVDQCNRKG